MTNDNEMPEPFLAGDPFGSPEDAVPAAPRVRRRGRGIKAAALGTIVAGGIAAASIVGPLAVDAASPTPAATTTPAATGNTDTDMNPKADGDHPGPGRGDHAGPGRFGHNEAVSDASVVATAIGITEADLNTALQGGQTIAQVAKAHNVATQTVIDALVQDGLDELAAQVKAGTITQAQADSMKTQVTQRATDQVNGTFMGGPGRGDHAGPARFGHNEAVSDASVVAKAIGITEADLNTALQGGQTIAQVAKAHNVATQTVIDALVQDGLDELAAQVKAGTITQAQADSMKTQVTQRATDQVNGTFMGGPRH